MSQRTVAKANSFPRSLRLIRTADYGVLVHARGENVIRVSSRFFSATVMKQPDRPGSLRFGITVGKRNSPRSVDRALVKRVLRESARHEAGEILARMNETEGLDVSLRLKTPLVEAGGREAARALKLTLRADADSLLRRLVARLAERTKGAPTC